MAECPTCEGRGVMPGAFYGDPREVVTCRSCGGRTTVEATDLTVPEPADGYGDLDLTGS